MFSAETIERYIAESLDLLRGARINVYVPVLAHRSARERQKALAHLEGAMVKEAVERQLKTLGSEVERRLGEERKA